MVAAWHDGADADVGAKCGGRHPIRTIVQKAWEDESPVNTKKRYGFNPAFTVVRTDDVHPQYDTQDLNDFV